MNSLVWFVTGASRGFGLEIARTALERGDAVVAAARDPQAVDEALGKHKRFLAVALDVTVEAQAEELSAWREVALSTEYREAAATNAAPHGAGKELL